MTATNGTRPQEVGMVTPVARCRVGCRSRKPRKTYMTKFHTILIDPPWNEQGGGKIKRGADRHYGLMKVEKILETIRRSGKFTPDENCHLYLWVTNNYLPDGIWLIEQLGFKYITCITWVKPSYGLGRYFRGQTEQLLFARRGNGWKLRCDWTKKHDLATRLDAEGPKTARGRRKHSAKPEEAYRLIKEASPDPRLDMFARRRRRGWWVWGKEVPTRKALRARKLQGKYLGALRGLTAEDKARVKAVAKEKGVAQAVKLAQTMKVKK